MPGQISACRRRTVRYIHSVLAKLIKTIRAFFENRTGIAAVYLFGSMARGTAHSDSDVDIGVLFEVAPPKTLAGQPFGMAADLGSLLGREVEIIVLNDAPVDLVHRVLRDGIIVSEPNKSKRIAFEVRSRNLYWDLKPMLDEYRRARA